MKVSTSITSTVNPSNCTSCESV